MLTDAIDTYGIYSDQKLQKFVYNLENRFHVHDETEHFGQLVNFSRNVDIPYHNWFRYREGFSHTLIRELLQKSKIKKDEYVLDPFCGSGTTVVEAALNGFSGIGMDINPMAAFISRVKCRSYTDEEISRVRQLLKNLPETLHNQRTPEDYIKKYQEVQKFFNNNNFERLMTVRHWIDTEKKVTGSEIYELLLCAYICVIEEISDRKRDGNGLKSRASKVCDVEQYFAAKLKRMTDDIEKHRISDGLQSSVIYGNAMKLSETVGRYSAITGKTLGTIMFSPPYANSFDYFESYKMEVILGDYAENMKDIGEYRQQAVESFVGRNDPRTKVREFVELMSEEIEAAIPEKEKRTGKRDTRTRKVPKMIKGYFTDMEKVIAESSEVLNENKKCYIVVDQSAYLGKIVPTDLFLAAIAEDYGFLVEEIIICRKARTSTQQIQRYPYLKDSLRESIVILKKM